MRSTDDMILMWELVNHPGWQIYLKELRVESETVISMAMAPEASDRETQFYKGGFSMLQSIITKGEELRKELNALRAQGGKR
ncbi:MAG: hypothetical protein AAGU11_08700 [Syntrophobacteraceae bacterium]